MKIKSILVMAVIMSLNGCAEIPGLPQVILPTPIPTSAPTDFQGVWNGRGHQYSNDQNWTIRMTLKGNQYQIDYPSLRCGGALELISATPNKLSFREHLTYGNCIDKGLTVITKINQNNVKFDWYYQDGKKGAEGALTRQ